MAEWICEQCDAGFKRDKAGDRQIRFCSQKCYWLYRRNNGGEFKVGFEPGMVPWNKGTKGVMKRNSGSFSGGYARDRAKLGDVRIRTRKRDGKKRAWVKIKHPNVWKLRSVVVWEKRFGKTPSGCIIHHIDRDTLNDSITNLACLSRAAHLKEHRHEFDNKRKTGLRRKRNTA